MVDSVDSSHEKSFNYSSMVFVTTIYLQETLNLVIINKLEDVQRGEDRLSDFVGGLSCVSCVPTTVHMSNLN